MSEDRSGPPVSGEPDQLRQARTVLAGLAGGDLGSRIAGYDDVHRLLQQALAALDVATPSGSR